jgi:predicted dehydrogenase
MIKTLLICGLGSIGRRHLRHFRALGVERIDAYRTGKATLVDEGQPIPNRVFESLEQALAEHPEAVIVANPTSLHTETALAAVKSGAHVLVEKPVSNTRNGLDILEEEAKKRNLCVCVGFNMRFHPALRAVHQIVSSGTPLGKPLMARIHFGTFLPDWHPWEDYKKSYAAMKNLGGGVTLTNSHELDYALWILGSADQVIGMTSTLNPLGTNVEELSAVLIRHSSGAISAITLSFAQKPPSRGIEMAFERGSVKVDLLAGSWVISEAGGAKSEQRVNDDFQIDETYRLQAQAFMRAVEGHREDLASLADAGASLAIAENVMEAR